MKNNKLASLVVLALLELPRWTTQSFTVVRPVKSHHPLRRTSQLHGLEPNSLTRDRSPDSEAATAAIPEVTELAVDAGKEGEELTETQTLLQKVKQAGTAGAISYALWELGFWGVSIPVCVAGYREVTGHWPDFSNKEDLEKLGAEAFAFVNFARLAVPLRIGLALSTTSWIDENVVQKFMKNKEQ